MFKRILILFVTSLCLFSCMPNVDNSKSNKRQHEYQYQKHETQRKKKTPENINEECNPAVFVIYGMFGQGSGFYIGSKGLALSNYHVFANEIVDCIRIEEFDGREFGVSEVLYADEVNDFIIFRVSGYEKKKFLRLAKKRPRVGATIYTLGSPYELKNTFSDGKISALRSGGLIQISAPIDHGSSGGALLNEYGEVIGITTAGYDKSNANLNFAIDINIVKPHLPRPKPHY